MRERRGQFTLGAVHYNTNRRPILDAGAHFGLFAGMTVGLTKPSKR